MPKSPVRQRQIREKGNVGKSIHKNVRITKEQGAQLEKKCSSYGINTSECIRRLIDDDRGKKVLVQTQEDYLQKKQMIYELKRIGNNINQIVKNVNMQHYTDYEKKKLFAMMQKILELFEGVEKGEKRYENESSNGSREAERGRGH